MMRYIFLNILLISGALISPDKSLAQDLKGDIQECALSAGNDVTYLKDFIVNLDAAQPGQKPPIFRTTLALRKGIIYRFTICNGDFSEGEAVLRLYDESNLLFSTFYPESGKEYKSVTFSCQKSAAYTVIISFKEGKKGNAIGILSYVNK